MTPEMQKLLERYHDREVSTAESSQVEDLLAKDAAALEYLGSLDEIAEMYQTAVHSRVGETSFDGFWGKVSARIAAEEQAQQALGQPETQGLAARLGSWLHSIFIEHKSAWITACATAAAVALVLSFMGPPTVNNTDGGSIVKVEKHIIYVDSVENPNEDSMVLVNSIEDKTKGETKVIWLLPNQMEEDQAEDNEDDGIEIVDEPL
jgi:hypothetical protein